MFDKPQLTAVTMILFVLGLSTTVLLTRLPPEDGTVSVLQIASHAENYEGKWLRVRGFCYFAHESQTEGLYSRNFQEEDWRDKEKRENIYVLRILLPSTFYVRWHIDGCEEGRGRFIVVQGKFRMLREDQFNGRQRFNQVGVLTEVKKIEN